MTLDLNKLAEELRTQDNDCTADSIYLVQEERIVYGFESQYAEKYHWFFPDDGEYFEVPEDGEGLPLDEDQAEEFGYEKAYYNVIHEFKCAHFTLKAAEQYIERQRHNPTNPRVWIESMHRCPEMIAIREFLMNPKIIPTELFDGEAVLKSLTENAAMRTSPENVSDVLDAVVKLIKYGPENGGGVNEN